VPPIKAKAARALDKAKRAADEAGAATFGQAADVPKYPDKLLIYLAKKEQRPINGSLPTVNLWLGGRSRYSAVSRRHLIGAYSDRLSHHPTAD
jgi:hypothetical protein